MVQTGIVRSTTGRAYEDYVSMHKHLRWIYGDRCIERYAQRGQTSTAALVEIENPGTTAHIGTDIVKTAVAIGAIGAGAEKAADVGKIITLVYKDNLGVSHTATCTIALNFHDTEQAFVPAIADFYCPVSLAVSAASANDMTIRTAGGGTTYGTITAAATAATDAQLIGVGQIYGFEDADTTHAGPIATLTYLTPWGEQKTAHVTYPAVSNTATVFDDTTTGIIVKDFYRRKDFVVNTIAADEYRVGNGAKNAWYGSIDIANYCSVHTRIFVPAAAYGKVWMGDIKMTIPSIGDVFTLTALYTPKGAAYSETVSWDVFASDTLNICCELEPLSEVQLKFKKTADANHVVCNFHVRWCEVLPKPDGSM